MRTAKNNVASKSNVISSAMANNQVADKSAVFTTVKSSDDTAITAKNRSPVKCQPSNAISFGVLGGALLSSYIFGFPVFCLVCPIGLTFGTILAVKRLLFGWQPSLELLLLPLFLIIELLVMRSWCATFCPLGALLKIISNTRLKLIKPHLDPAKCYQEQDINCQVCLRDCPERVNLRADPPPRISNCTNCLECWQKCPTRAIKLVDLPSWGLFRK
jgi:ferredoxin